MEVCVVAAVCEHCTVKIIERKADSPYYIQAYTDGSKSEAGVRAGIAIYQDNNLTSTLKYQLSERCTNNLAEQIAILKALEHIQSIEMGGKIVLIHTDSQITLQLLQNKKKHTRLIELIRTKINEMEQHKWSVEFTWIKAHTGHRGNETADQLAKEAANNKNIEESYTKIPKSAIPNELKENSIKQWQSECENATKGETAKLFFPKVEDRLEIRINTTPKFTTITTGNGNIKSYLYKCKIIDNPQCQRKNGDQTVEHIIFECTNFDQERDKLKAVVMRKENWPVSFNKLSTIYYINFKEYIDSVIWDND